MLRNDSKKSVEKLERRKGLFLENYHPFVPSEASADSLSGIRKREDKFTLESEQLIFHEDSARDGGVSLTLHTTNHVGDHEIKSKQEQETNKIYRITEELLQNEQKYIKSLKNGIKDFILPFDTFPLPQTLSGQRLNIFSNIEVILEFHEKKFFPKLVECGHDPAKIADVFVNLIQANNFDNYISYVILRKTSSKLCEENKYFFKQLEKDQLGVDSFLLQPVQRLPKYQLMLDKLVKELTKDLQKNKIAIGKCCMAEKSIQRLLNVVNKHCEVS